MLLLVYATGLSIAIGLRQPVLLRIMPDRITLYSVSADGKIHNRFRMVASNRGKVRATVSLAVADLEDGSIESINEREVLEPGQSVQQQFDVVVPTSSLHPGINRMRIIADVSPGKTGQVFQETFFAPQ